MILLAFDVGRKKTGIAIGNMYTALARPLRTVRGHRHAQITAIGAQIQQWRPQQLLFGLPHHMDGGAHNMTRFCRDFAAVVQQQYSLPVAFVDERLSTVSARTLDGDIDATAAAIILQDWLRANCAPAADACTAGVHAESAMAVER